MNVVHNNSIGVFSAMVNATKNLNLKWLKGKKMLLNFIWKKKKTMMGFGKWDQTKVHIVISQSWKHLITPQGIEKQMCKVVLRGSQNIWNSQNLATESEQT